MTSHGQCPRGGACECPRVGAFFKLMTSRGQCPRGGGAPGVPPIQVQTPPTWLAGYGPGIDYSFSVVQVKMSPNLYKKTDSLVELVTAGA